MYSEFLSLVRTSFDRELLINEIDLLVKAFYEPKSGGVEAALKTAVRASIAPVFRTKMEQGNFEDFLEGLRAELMKLPELKLTLAFEPTEEVLTRLNTWIVSNVGNVVISFDIDRSLLAGAIVSYQGNYYDGSLLKITEEYFASNSKKLNEAFNN